MGKRKEIKVTWGGYKISGKDFEDYLGGLKPTYYWGDDARETYKHWGIDYAEEMSKMFGIEKDKSEMKVTGTIVNNKIVLDKPVEYVGVFTKHLTSLRNGNRYEFEVKTMGSSKPEIANVTKITNERNVNWTIRLAGSLIENYSNRSHAEQIVVKAIAQNIVESSIEAFKIAKTEYLDKVLETGHCVVYSGDDVFEKLLQLNSTEFHGEKVAFFHVTTDENESENQSDNHIKPDGIFVENFYLQSDLVPMLPVFKNAIEAGERFSLMLTGEAGYGKTSAFKAIAQQLEVPYLYVDCSVMLNTTDWFGIMQAKDGSTYFEETEFTRFLKNGNCVIILDEFNRLSIEVANSLLPILDDRHEIRVKNQQITVGDGILFGITLNEGIEYTGVGGMLDKAIKSRIFGRVEVKPLPFDIEIQVLTRNYDLPLETAEKIVSVMDTLRDVCKREREQMNFITADVSTRTSKMIAWWVEKGLDIHQALEYALYNFVGRDERVLFVDAIKARINL